MRKIVLLTIFSILFIQLCAQDSTSTNQEVWPEINFFYKFNDKIRLFAFYSATKLHNSSFTDGGFGAYMEYFAFPFLREKLNPNLRDSTRGYYLWIRAGYLHSASPPESTKPIEENTLVTEFNLRFHLPYQILLTNRNRFDWRIINGEFEPRYRPRLVFEKDMRTEYLYFTPNIYAEYYVYFNESGLNRFRLSAGIQIKVTTHLEFETYYVHQFDNGKRVQGLDAMGLVLKFYFKHVVGKKKSTSNEKAM